MEKIEKHYPGHLIFNCSVERNGGEVVTIFDISIKRLIKISKHPKGKRLAKILNRQFLKFKFPGFNIMVGPEIISYGDADGGWNIKI